MERNLTIWSTRYRQDLLCQSLCNNGLSKILLSLLSRFNEQVLRWVWEACLRSFWACLKKSAISNICWRNRLNLRKMRRGWKWILLKSKEWVFNTDGWHWGPEWSALHNCSHKPAMVHWLCNFEKIWEKSLHSFTRPWGMMIHGWEKAQRFGWAIKTSGLWINCFENRELFWLWSRAALWRCCHAAFVLCLENQQL